MPIFRNTNYVGRVYDCTNIVAAEAPSAPTHWMSGSPCQPGDWAEASGRGLLDGLTKLCRVGDVTYYGHL